MNVDVRLEQGSGKCFLIESNPRFWATLAAPVGFGQLAQEVPAMAWRIALRGKRSLAGKTPQTA